MEENSLIYLTSPKVTIATNTFVNVPVILKYEDINLIEIINEQGVGFTTQIPIYHSDGTYLAKVVGTRMFLTDEGKKAGLNIEKHNLLWACTMDGKTLFEIQQQGDDSFKTSAELYTPDGHFLKCTESPIPNLLDTSGNEINLGGVSMKGMTIQGYKIGIWVKKDGVVAIGAN